MPLSPCILLLSWQPFLPGTATTLSPPPDADAPHSAHFTPQLFGLVCFTVRKRVLQAPQGLVLPTVYGRFTGGARRRGRGSASCGPCR